MDCARHARLIAASLLLCVACDRTPAEAPSPTLVPSPSRPTLAPGALEAVSPGVSLRRLRRSYDDAIARVFVVRVEVPRVRFELRSLPEHRFVPLMMEGGFAVATNAGFFEPDFSRSGLVVDHGEVRAPYHPRGGTGIFVVRGGRASLVQSPDEVPTDVDVALQCGPRLVEPDGSLGIHRDDGRRAARTALCIRGGGRVVDWVIAFREDGPGGPGLGQLASWLYEGLVPGEGGCDAALNLDGGPSTALAVPAVPEVRRIPPGPVVEALLARSVTEPP